MVFGRSYRLSVLTGGVLSLILVASIVSYGYVTSSSEANSRIEQLRASHSQFSAEVAHGCAYYIVLGDYAGLEQYLQGVGRMGDVFSISVIDAEGMPLSELVGTEGSPLVPAATPRPFPAPHVAGTTITMTAAAMDIVTPIINAKKLGWLKVSFDIRSIEGMKADIWKRSLAMGGIWIVLSLAFTMILLRYPEKAIRRLAAFATGLPASQGEEMEIPQRIEELRELGQALNFASTELYSKEFLLRRERDLLKEAQRVAHIGSWDWDAVNDVIWWSAEYYRIHGFDPDVPPPNYVEHLKAYTVESAARLDEVVRRAMETGAPYEVDLELSAPTVSTRWIVARGEVKRDTDGKICGLRGTAQDITERKIAEANLFRLNRELRAISNCNQVLVHAVDEQSLVNEICRIICEDAGFRMAWVGYAEDDADKTIRPVAWAGVEDGYLEQAKISWADTERGLGPSGTAIRTGQPACSQDFSTDPAVTVWRSSALDRGYRSSIALPLKGEDDKPFGVLNIYSSEPETFTSQEIRLMEELSGDLAFGITVLRARIEQERAQWEIALMSFALDSVGESALLIDEHARFRYVNRESCRKLGYESEELLGLSVADVDPDFPAERWPDHWREIQKSGSLLFEGRHRKRDGSIIPVEINANYFEYGGEGYNLALVRDITERRRAEEALRESESRLNEAQRIAHIGCWELDIVKNVLVWSGEIYNIFELDRERFGATYEAFLEAVHPDDRQMVDSAYTGSLRDRTPYEIVHRLLMPDGRIKHVRERCETSFGPDGTALRSLGTVQDISSQIESEESLKKLNERFTLAADAAHMGVWDWDIVNNELDWDDRMYDLYGIRKDEFSGAYEAWLNGVHPDDRSSSDEVSKRALAGETPYDTEFRVVWPDGSVHYLKAYGLIIRHEDGSPLRMTGINYDITLLRRTEEERNKYLRFVESMDRVNRAMLGAKDMKEMMGNVLDEVISILDCDRAFLLYPCDPDAPTWSVPFERTKPEYPGALQLGLDIPMREDVMRKMYMLLKLDCPVMFGPGTENPLPEHVSKQFGFKSLMSMAIRPKSGKPWEFGLQQCSHVRTWTPEEELFLRETGMRLSDALSTWLVFQDLQDREWKLSEAQRIAHIGYWDRDIPGNRITLSDESCRIFGISLEDMHISLDRWHRLWLELIHPEDRNCTEEAALEALRGGKPYNVEYRIVRPDGEVRHIHSEANVTMDASGQAIRMLGMMQDITERKRAEDEILRSLKEKDVLLKEIHHRVKNNMAVISAILNMQSAYVRDAVDRDMFKECQSRIKSMALVHEKLYRSESLSEINVREYMQSLAYEISKTCGISQPVESNVEVEDCVMDIDVLLPCGLIVNELLMNSYKHAFVSVEHPRVTVSLKSQDDNYILVVSDNGVGLPQDFDINESQGLGFKLITALCDQISGSLSYERDGGTTFRIIFPKV